jgi:hypothetical protein
MKRTSKLLVMLASVGIITQGIHAESWWGQLRNRLKPSPEFLYKMGYRDEPRDYGNVPEYVNASPFDLYQQLYQQQRLEEQKQKNYLQLNDPFKASMCSGNEWNRLEEKKQSLRETPGKSLKSFWISQDRLGNDQERSPKAHIYPYPALPYIDEPETPEKPGNVMWAYPSEIEGYPSGNIDPVKKYQKEARGYTYYFVPYSYTEDGTGRTLSRPTSALEDRLEKLKKQIENAQNEQQRIYNIIRTPQQYDY